MRNFGEELAYWYLRLNGFFLIDNFVLHSADLKSSQSADADVIGIRNPHTVEKIGMFDVDDISPNLVDFEPKIKEKTVVVISEVKTSPTKQKILLQDEHRLKYIIKRTGLFEAEIVDEVSNQLFNNKSYSPDGSNISILKIIFSQFEYSDDKFYCLSLGCIENQIIEKIYTYIDDKNPSKHLFPSTLMQYLIWKIRQENGLERQEEIHEKVAYPYEKIN